MNAAIHKGRMAAPALYLFYRLKIKISHTLSSHTLAHSCKHRVNLLSWSRQHAHIIETFTSGRKNNRKEEVVGVVSLFFQTDVGARAENESGVH